ncbi:MAG: Mur ligase family protein [Patescibacteria group bacterium]|nr:Mur ligase family protein [Patescibacteria group bacterium]
MNNIISKIKFIFKKQKIVLVVGRTNQSVFNTIIKILNPYFKIGKEVLVFKTEDKEIFDYEFFLKNSEQAILVITNVGDIPCDSDFFAGEREPIENTRKLVENLPENTNLVLNFDDETSREIGDLKKFNTLRFGLQKEADFRASDIKLNGGTNFKINYKGKIVPVWLKNAFGKEQIYSALAAGCVASVFDLNLVKISEAFKNYLPLDGRMKLIKGIKNSWVLDDSASSSVFSMIEAIEVLGKLQGYNRKIAVLGDVLNIGKYTIEAHEAIGERVAKNADLLFVFGQRAKFIAKGAFEKGMKSEQVFEFDAVDQGKLKLQDIIEENDIILVDGSSEMQMNKIVKEITGQ